jgi:GxxExxY protein
MPIRIGAEIHQMNDEEFKSQVYEVMRHVFDVQRELGRLFPEKIYQREIAFRLPDAQREVPVELQFDGFSKTYFLDLLVGGGAVFEMKTVGALTDNHRRQLLNYLFFTGLPHGKLVNLRPERVEHEFINNTLTLADRTSFELSTESWQEPENGSLLDDMIALLRDWGTGLDLSLYEEVAAFLCGHKPNEETEIDIQLNGRCLGAQQLSLIAPQTAIRITALPPERHEDYESHLHRFLEHTDLQIMQWINITRALVQFKTVKKRI